MYQFSMILHNPNAQKFFHHFLPPRPLKIFILFIIKANYHNSTTITSINFKFGSWYHWMMGPDGYKIEVYLKRCSRFYKKCPKKPKETVGSWYHWMMGPDGYKIEVYLKRCSRFYKKCPKKPKETAPYSNTWP